MKLMEKNLHKAHSFNRQSIVCEQYPMLTYINRKEWLDKGVLGLVYILYHVSAINPKGIPTNEDLKVSLQFIDIFYQIISVPLKWDTYDRTNLTHPQIYLHEQ